VQQNVKLAVPDC